MASSKKAEKTVKTAKVVKATPVKATPKTEKVAVDFNIKQVGQNLIIVFGEEKFSRKFTDPAQREQVKELASKYSFKPSAKLLKEIKTLMQVDKVAREKTIKEVKKAGTAVKPAKPPKEKLVSKEEQIAEAKKLLEDNNFNVTAKQATPARQRKGEY